MDHSVLQLQAFIHIIPSAWNALPTYLIKPLSRELKDHLLYECFLAFPRKPNHSSLCSFFQMSILAPAIVCCSHSLHKTAHVYQMETPLSMRQLTYSWILSAWHKIEANKYLMSKSSWVCENKWVSRFMQMGVGNKMGVVVCTQNVESISQSSLNFGVFMWLSSNQQAVRIKVW